MYFRVKDRLPYPLPDHHQFGYETALMFEDDIYYLHRKWAGKEGRSINHRNDFHQIRFYNRYGAYQDAWLPDFMLTHIPDPPEAPRNKEQERTEEFLDKVFGFN